MNRILLPILLLVFSCEEPVIDGCTTTTACNYNIDADKDDGSCIAPQGCNAWCESSLEVVVPDTTEVSQNGALELDCADVCGGDAVEDECGVCSGGNTGVAINNCNSTIGIGLCQNELINYLKSEYKTTTVFSYNDARDVLYGVIDNKNGEVSGIYTNFTISNIPSEDPRSLIDAGGINCEHIWPQSMFTGESPMKSDLHHLRPAKSNVNSSRQNKPYGDIDDDQTDTWYWKDISLNAIPSSNLDEYSETKSDVFEPREDRKGDISRTMFYFYTIYPDEANEEFFSEQKEILKTWHEQDPVNEDEINRTWAISVYQDDMPNPFILDNTLIDRAYFSDETCEQSDDETEEEDADEDDGSVITCGVSGIVLIYNAVDSPTESESVTLKNNYTGSVDISGWKLGDKNDPDSYNIPQNTILTFGMTITFSHTTLNFQINNSNETLYLYDGCGTLIDTWSN